MLRWWRRDREKRDAEPERATPEPGRPFVREAERRLLARLLRRREELRYDLAQSEHALQPENRWTERLRELDAAIADVEHQRAQRAGAPARTGDPPLPAVPIAVTVEPERTAATVTLDIAGVALRWVEEVDWAERGHQLAPARLRRVEGNATEILRAVGYQAAPAALLETLEASLDLVAADALSAARREPIWSPLTLGDLARPCEQCGGWRDVRGRCPTCTARDWQRQQLLLERNRLRQERDEVFRDWQRARDRLPVIQRQLAEVEADIRQLQTKGVQPSGEG
ncbi:hypothetical protein OO015_04285 [Thermomicrobium sp. 4228-Ro]|uniref:hypothetical protein n=1 Tax=Thermomicrobium sp. 4228-Ro TaxID=2993937 RepID=UPI002248DEAB|nr:hypothetical protein [Thermomicrobium sp. 4228-Ro]MCX2726711.1 hypothetical protein [Thermomicrobium sp. 4228-Ro]